MKSAPRDLSWLPPSHEWDFREIDAEECRVACWWEYARTIPQIANDPNEWSDNGPGRESNFIGVLWNCFILFTHTLFPGPWLGLSMEQRQKLADQAKAVSIARVEDPRRVTVEQIRMAAAEIKAGLKWGCLEKSDGETEAFS